MIDENKPKGEQEELIPSATTAASVSETAELLPVQDNGIAEELYAEPAVEKEHSDTWRKGFLEAQLIFDEASASVGSSGSAYNAADWNKLMEDAQSDDIAVRKKALADIVNDPSTPLPNKIALSDALVQLDSIVIPTGNTAQRAAAVTRRAYENAAMDDGVYESRVGLIEQQGTPAGQQMQDVLLGADNTKWLANLEKMQAAGVPPSAIYQSYVTELNDKSKFFSWDTAALMTVVGGITEMNRGYAMLADVKNPKLDAVLSRYSGEDAFSNASGTGQFGANVTYRTFLRKVSDVVAKDFTDEERIDMLKKFTTWINTPNKYTSGDGNWHVYAQVVSASLEQVLNPKYNTATMADVAEAVARQDGVGGKVLAGLSRLADTPIGDEVAVMAQDLLTAFSWFPAAAGLKSVAKTAFAKIPNAMPATFNKMMLVKPRSFNASLAKAVQEDPEILEAAGLGGLDELISASLPTTRDLYTGAGAHPNIVPYMREIATNASRIKQALVNISNNYVSMIPDSRVVEGMREYASRKNVAPWANMSAIRANNGIIEVTGTWGRTPEEGFATATEASAALKRAFGSDVAVEPVLRHKLTQQLIRPSDEGYDELVEVAKKSDSYDWVGSIDYNTSVDNWANVPELIEASIVGQKTNVFDEKIVRTALGRMLISPISWAEAGVSNKLTWVAGNNRRIQDLLARAQQPFSERLWQGDKDKVNAVIMAQFQEGKAGPIKTLNEAELIDRGLTSKTQQMAYWNYRALTDVAYDFADTNFAKSLRSEGYEDLLDAAGVRVGFVKEATLGDVSGNYSGPIRIIEDGVVDVMEKNVSDIRALTDDGGYKLYAMKQAEWFGDDEILYSLVKADDIDKHVMRIPDRGVLPRVEGYYTEIHQAPYAVYGMSKSGRKHYIGTAESTVDAVAGVSKVRSMPEYASKFSPESVSYELMQGYRDIITLAKRNETPVENMGGIVFGHKTGDLKNFSGDLSPANKLDPLSATLAMWSALGSTYTKGRLIQHRETLGDRAARDWGLASDVRNRITSVEQLVGKDKLNDMQLKQYDHLKDWFSATDAFRIQPDAADVAAAKLSRALASAWAYMASKVTGEGAFAKSLREFAGKREAGQLRAAANPTDLGRVWTSFNHLRNIVMNPMKHMPMNLAQTLQNLAHVTSYAKAIRDFNGLTTAIVANDNAILSGLTKAERNATFRKIAKEMKISTEELEALVDAATTGGVWNAAQHNYMHRQATRTQGELAALGSMDTTKRGALAENIKDIIQSSYKTTRTIAEEAGHALGENMANMSTFLTQYHYLKGTTGFDIRKQASKELLVGKTLGLAGNMSAEWALGLQRGFFKAPFQYSAFNLKMMFNILPAPLGGSKQLTAAEKLSMFVSQAMVWGVDSVIFGRQMIDQFENWFINDPNISEEEREQRRQAYAEDSGLKRVVEHGWLGAGFNELVHWTTLAALSPDDWEFQEDLDFGDMLAFGGGYDLPYQQMIATLSSAAIVVNGALSTVTGGGFLNDEAQDKLLQETLTAIGGSNQRTVLNIQQWLANVSKTVGDASDGRRPWGESVRYIASETSRTAVGGLADKHYWLSVSRQMGIEIQNGRPVGKEFRDTLANRLRAYTGIRLESEQDWQRLNDMMREDAANLRLDSKDRKSQTERKAKQYVSTMLSEIAAFPNDREGHMIADQLLNKTNVEMSYLMSAMPQEEAQELRAAIYAEISKAVSPKDSRRDSALKLLGKLSPELHTEEGRKKVLRAAATSESYNNTVLGRGLVEFLEQDRIKRQLEGSEE